MDNKKICFIMCSNNEFLARECLLYIEQLNVPEGFSIETLVVQEAHSMTEGYNEAMRASDAKYKIYLHQDVLLLHKDMLLEIVGLFERHPEVGMLGVVGNTKITEDGRPFGDMKNRRVGEVIADLIGGMSNSSFKKVTGEYQSVIVLDGLFMATQYDISWREDLFKGWDFYDCSQSVEFWKAGYQVVVPCMDKAWCLHDNDILNLENYDKWRFVFVEEYSDYYQSWMRERQEDSRFVNDTELISVIIPTFNRRKTIRRAIDSVLNQTYKNIELIIVDDGSTDGTFEMVSDIYGDDERVIYIVNEINSGPSGARNIGVEAASGTWIAFHDSDDEWHLDKIEKQMSLLYNSDESVGMVYCQLRWNYDDGSTRIWPPKELPMGRKSGDIFEHVLIGPLCSTQTMLIRKDYFENIGGFATDIHSLEDYEFSIRFAKYYKVLLYDEPLVEVYESINSVGKRTDEKIRVQCMIMQAYRDDYIRFNLRENKMLAVWKEAKAYDNIAILEDNVSILKNDEVFWSTFLDLQKRD